jgi:hypothetical protein
MADSASGATSWLRRLSLVLLGVLVGAAGVWAVEAVTRGASEPDPSASVLAYTVGVETVGRSMPIVVVVDRSRELAAINLLGGMVTRVSDLREPVTSGMVVYEVAGVPVRIVEGSFPFYREMVPGMEGEDVAQLQAVLVSLGYVDLEPDGRFGASTGAAVRDWRRDLGLTAGNRVGLGELIAVEGLPRLVEVGDGIRVGRLVSPGLEALFVLGAEPVFEVPLSESQVQAMDPGASLVVEYEGLEWPAVVLSSRSEPERGQVVLTLAAPGGGPVCGRECDRLPPSGRLQLRGRIVLVPPTSGPAVPVGALRTDAAGEVSVRLESGERRTVEVVAISGGLAVVEGLAVGERVLLGGATGTDENG